MAITRLHSQLRQAIEEARAGVQQHPAHGLSPFYRKQIYDLIGPMAERPSRCIRAQLAIISAQRIAFIWGESRPQDDRIDQLITLAKDILRDTVIKEVAEKMAGEAWDWLTNDYGDRNEELHDGALYVMAAALEAVFASLGVDRFHNVIIDQNMTDTDLDPWCSDTALYAAAALAGPLWEPGSSSERRKEFWEWWLSEAILSAHQRCESSGYAAQ